MAREGLQALKRCEPRSAAIIGIACASEMQRAYVCASLSVVVGTLTLFTPPPNVVAITGKTRPTERKSRGNALPVSCGPFVCTFSRSVRQRLTSRRT